MSCQFLSPWYCTHALLSLPSRWSYSSAGTKAKTRWQWCPRCTRQNAYTSPISGKKRKQTRMLVRKRRSPSVSCSQGCLVFATLNIRSFANKVDDLLEIRRDKKSTFCASLRHDMTWIRSVFVALYIRQISCRRSIASVVDELRRSCGHLRTGSSLVADPSGPSTNIVRTGVCSGHGRFI